MFPRSFEELRYFLAEKTLCAAIAARRRLLPKVEFGVDGPTPANAVPPQEFPHELVQEGIFRYASGGIAIRYFEQHEARWSGVGVPRFKRETWNRFDPIIATIADRTGVPSRIIKAVIATESSFDPKAKREEPRINDRSRGLMQLLERTARGLGYKGALEGLYDPIVNIELGARLLADLYHRHGSWDDALAAYNGGKPRKTAAGQLVPILAEYVGKVNKWLRELSPETVATSSTPKPPAPPRPPSGFAAKIGAGAAAAIFGLFVLRAVFVGRRSDW